MFTMETLQGDLLGWVWEEAVYIDCLHRVKGRADWVSNPHTDEYFIPKPPHTVSVCAGIEAFADKFCI